MQHKILSAKQLRPSGKESTTFELYNLQKDISEENSIKKANNLLILIYWHPTKSPLEKGARGIDIENQ